MRAVIAGFGSVLRADDGVGLAVLDRLRTGSLPPEVELLEVGTGGIHLVQRLLDPVDLLVVVDSVEAGRPPGTVLTIEAEVPDLLQLSPLELRDQASDMHLANPDRALAVARGLGVLPTATWLVGVQTGDADGWGEELSPAVAGAVDEAVAEVRRVVQRAGVAW